MGVNATKSNNHNGQAKLPKSLEFDPILFQQLRAVRKGIIEGPIVGDVQIGKKLAAAYLHKFTYDFRLEREGKERKKPTPIEDIVTIYKQSELVLAGALSPFSVGKKDFTPAVARQFIAEHRKEVEAYIKGSRLNSTHPMAEGIRH